MVAFNDGTDPCCARVWDAVLGLFLDMGKTRTSARAEAWQLQHDASYHNNWAVAVWVPSAARYERA